MHFLHTILFHGLLSYWPSSYESASCAPKPLERVSYEVDAYEVDAYEMSSYEVDSYEINSYVYPYIWIMNAFHTYERISYEPISCDCTH